MQMLIEFDLTPYEAALWSVIADARGMTVAEAIAESLAANFQRLVTLTSEGHGVMEVVL